MITLDQLKTATLGILNTERPKFDDALAIAHDDIVADIIDRAAFTEFLEDYEPENEIDLSDHGYDTYAEYVADLDQTRIDDWCEEVYRACQDIGVEAGEYLGSVDYLEYFAEHSDNVYTAHEDLGFEGWESLFDQISSAVSLARNREAEEHAFNLMCLFDTPEKLNLQLDQ